MTHDLDEALLSLGLQERAEFITGLVSEFVIPIGYRKTCQRIYQVRRSHSSSD